MPDQQHRAIYTESPIKAVWNWLGALSSVEVSKRILLRHPPEPAIDEAGSLDRAASLAFTVRSAKDYFHGNPEANLTESCLAYYYGLLSLLEALVIASPVPPHSMAELETYTRRGHGVHNLSNPGRIFPESEVVYFLNRGFASIYGRTRNLRLDVLALPQQVSSYEELPNPQSAITLKDLLLRVPEIRSTTRELWPTEARCLFLSQWGNHNDGSVELVFEEKRNDPNLSPGTILRIVPELHGENFTEEAFNQAYGTRLIRVRIPAERRDHVPRPQQSALCFDSYVEKFGDCRRDMLLVHFLTLYLLSIFVRYRPNLWRQIVDGSLDQYRPIVAEYLQVVERVVPNLVLNELYDQNFFFQQLTRFV